MLNFEEILTRENKIDNFLNEYNSIQKPVLLMGVGGSIDAYLKLLNKYSIPISYILDNDASKHGKTINNIPIMPATIIEKLQPAYIIISAPSHVKDFTAQIYNISSIHEIILFDPTLEVIQDINNSDRRIFYRNHINDFLNTYNLLSDEASKLTLEKIIEGAICSDSSCYQSIATASQYFPDIIMNNLTENEIFLDIGAYTGDSTLDFISATKNKFNKIIGFEPKQENIEMALSQINDSRVEFYPYGIGATCETLYLHGNKGLDDFAYISNTKTNDSEIINITTIDEFINDNISYIKMDIEGMEIPALIGGKKQIKKNHPKLAISVYHKVDDLINIPKTILDIDPTYKLYLRHYWKYCGTDTVLFAL